MGLHDRDWYWKQVDRIDQKPPPRQAAPQRVRQPPTSFDELLRKPSSTVVRDLDESNADSVPRPVLPVLLLIGVILMIAVAGAWVIYHPDLWRGVSGW
ncbi:hypothetical protein Thivi_0144 [Thiocystis violascens DSM 198]|uniref:Uncharacterized protein n=2 Tax=Thiocystis violascens TaxID=73141 RepID=I3Y5F2_THIV6|nr:hypothetical protein Thivi_0144 [Thiocystis violascens DSM 198]